MNFYFHLLSINKSISNLKLLHFLDLYETASIPKLKNLRLIAFNCYQKMHFPCSNFPTNIAEYSRLVLNAKWYEGNFSRDRRFSKISRDNSEWDRINRNLAHGNFRLISRVTDPYRHFGLSESKEIRTQYTADTHICLHVTYILYVNIYVFVSAINIRGKVETRYDLKIN